MSKTKLMKIGPARSQFRCRDRGKLKGKNGVRSGAVKKPSKVKAERKTASKLTLRRELLNPAKETMIPITYEDFVKMGRYSLHPGVDYKLCKYHDGLVHSGTFVTPALLRAKAIELFKEAGIPVNECKRSSQWIQSFMVRCGRFRAAKSRGIATDSISLKHFSVVYFEELRKMEPVCPGTRSKRLKACSCDKSSLKTLGISETSSPIMSLFAAPPPEPEGDPTEQNTTIPGTSLLNLFAADNEATVGASNSQPARKLTRIAIRLRGLCTYCLRETRKQDDLKNGRTRVGYAFPDYSFPELLPSLPRKTGSSKSVEEEDSFCDTELSDCSDSAATDLFNVAQSLL